MTEFHDPESHLRRAKDLLADGKSESLLYAALEFRYSVEGRLLQYAERADAFAKNRNGVWKVGHLAKHVDSVFKLSENNYSIEMQSSKMTSPVTIEYTPVSERVRTLVGRTDNFLHHAGVTQCVLESKFSQLRKLLEGGVAEMERCLAGGLHGTLVKDSTGMLHFNFDLRNYPELQQAFDAGDPVEMRIEITPFLDEPRA